MHKLLIVIIHAIQTKSLHLFYLFYFLFYLGNDNKKLNKSNPEIYQSISI